MLIIFLVYFLSDSGRICELQEEGPQRSDTKGRVANERDRSPSVGMLRMRNIGSIPEAH